MTLTLQVKCNRCGNYEDVDIKQLEGAIERAHKTDRPLSALTWSCGECNASDGAKAMERIFS